jgi:hypothetical protein
MKRGEEHLRLYRLNEKDRAVVLRALELADESALIDIESFCRPRAPDVWTVLDEDDEPVGSLEEAGEILAKQARYLVDRGLATISKDVGGRLLLAIHAAAFAREVR